MLFGFRNYRGFSKRKIHFSKEALHYNTKTKCVSEYDFKSCSINLVMLEAYVKSILECLRCCFLKMVNLCSETHGKYQQLGKS